MNKPEIETKPEAPLPVRLCWGDMNKTAIEAENSAKKGYRIMGVLFVASLVLLVASAAAPADAVLAKYLLRGLGFAATGLSVAFLGNASTYSRIKTLHRNMANALAEKYSDLGKDC